jgi:hypothetical protein
MIIRGLVHIDASILGRFVQCFQVETARLSAASRSCED